MSSRRCSFEPWWWAKTPRNSLSCWPYIVASLDPFSPLVFDSSEVPFWDVLKLRPPWSSPNRTTPWTSDQAGRPGVMKRRQALEPSFRGNYVLFITVAVAPEWGFGRCVKENLCNKSFLVVVKITLHFWLLHWISCFRDDVTGYLVTWPVTR